MRKTLTRLLLKAGLIKPEHYYARIWYHPRLRRWCYKAGKQQEWVDSDELLDGSTALENHILSYGFFLEEGEAQGCLMRKLQFSSRIPRIYHVTVDRSWLRNASEQASESTIITGKWAKINLAVRGV